MTPYDHLGIWGVPRLFEGLPTTLAYFTLAMAAARLPPIVLKRYLPLALILGGVVSACFGLLERYGVILINQASLRSWFLTTSDGYSATYTGKFKGVSLPFGNPNYVGMYAAMIWPFCFAWTIIATSRSKRLLAALCAVGIFALLAASGTRSAYIAGGLTVFACLVYALVYQQGKIPVCCLLLALHGCMYWTLETPGQRSPTKRARSIAREFSENLFADTPSALNTSGKTSTRPPATTTLDGDPTPNPTPEKARTKAANLDISIDQGRLRMTSQDWGIFIERQPHAIKFMDLSFRPLPLKSIAQGLEILDERFQGLKINLLNAGAFKLLNINDTAIAITDYGFRVGRAGIFSRPVVSERFPLPLHDKAFSKRGFIWSRTIPLLRKTLFLGMGSAAFPFEFPNNDYVAMSKYFGLRTIVDKPHSYYLGFAHAHGVVALGILLLLFSWNTVRSLQMLLPSQTTAANPIVLPYFAGFVGFILAALCNDSTVGVAAPFWVIFGASLGFKVKHLGLRS